ncbi:MAG TPA: DUF488 family protein [Chthoniobacterales bacterium]|nr:DUF488 family protein [Chthoniobacterales bacterium]
MSQILHKSKSKVSARQRLLIWLLEALGGKVFQTDFQKLLFLYSNEVETVPSFEFVPYRFGCFSFSSYADKRRLIDGGLLENDEASWQLTEAGQQFSRERELTALKISKFAWQYKELRGASLIAEVYRRYPYYAIHSEIIDQVPLLPQDRKRVDAARPPLRKPGLLTIGYEGKSLEAYLNQLIKAGVSLLCDVRRNPLSRKYGFSKSTLSEACKGVGIGYEHLPDLGIASSERRNISEKEDYVELFVAYRKNSLPKNQAALDQIKNWVTKCGQRVALTCFERDPLQCHRHCIAHAIAERTDAKLIALHLP